MLEGDERVIVLAQRIRVVKNAMTVDTPFRADCEIRGKRVRAIRFILAQGHLRTVQELTSDLWRSFGMKSVISTELIDGLYRLGLLTTNRRFTLTGEAVTATPSLLPLPPRTKEDTFLLEGNAPPYREAGLDWEAPVFTSLSERESCRAFAPGTPGIELVHAIVAAAYGGTRRHRSVPSAGSIYPCFVHALRREEGADTYEVTHVVPEIAYPKRKWDNQQLGACFLQGMPFGRAPIFLIISADTERATAKYGARGWRYAILEAGHIAQNAHLSAHAIGLATCEVGAFKEETVADALELPDETQPLIIIAIGNQDVKREVGGANLTERVIRAYAGPFNIVPSIRERERDRSAYPEPFMAEATVAIPKRHRGHGSGMTNAGGEADTPELARLKAVAEGIERYCAGWVPQAAFVGPIGKIRDKNAFPIYAFQRFAQAQRLPSGLKRFTPSSVAQWYPIVQWQTGHAGLVPGDLLFYPYEEGKAFSRANSSGVAAHTDPLTASWKAVAECLERENLLAWWYSGSRPVRLQKPPSLRHGILDAWNERGYEFRFLDLSLSIPVIGVIALNESARSAFVATAGGMDIEQASVHALSEVMREADWAEGAAASAQRIRPERVRNVEDHMRLYANGYGFAYMDWWSSGPQGSGLEHGHPRSDRPEAWLDWTMDNVGPVWFHDFALPPETFPDQPLTVRRALIPGVVSIRFGFEEQDLGLPRLRRLMKECVRLGGNNVRNPPRIHPLA